MLKWILGIGLIDWKLPFSQWCVRCTREEGCFLHICPDGVSVRSFGGRRGNP